MKTHLPAPALLEGRDTGGRSSTCAEATSTLSPSYPSRRAKGPVETRHYNNNSLTNYISYLSLFMIMLNDFIVNKSSYTARYPVFGTDQGALLCSLTDLCNLTLSWLLRHVCGHAAINARKLFLHKYSPLSDTNSQS